MPDETSYSPREVFLREREKTGSLVAFPRARPSERPSDNLPLELTSFIGREREVAEVKRLLAGRRLLTLCGPGGSGKTRLALAVAQDLIEGFEGGVWWVDLASLSEPKLVPGAVASALGVREAPDRSLTEVVVEHLKPRKTLLVLDNCEHLVERCAMLADTLMRACPDLEILATSREPLRTAGESTWLVPSLSLPDPRRRPPFGELAEYEAIRLFVERAKAVNADFALTERNVSAVARLCHGLDGIPLAIELAAARTRVLTAEQISEKLEDPLGLLTTGDRTGAPRHQTLRETLEWSHELLSEAEQALFRRLSVFAGGWTLQAAEEVCSGAEKNKPSEREGAPVERAEPGVLDLLSQLVDKSLVVSEAEAEALHATSLRYRMLEPVRQYGLEKLLESGEEPEARRRHAYHYLALAETAEPELLGAGQGEWLQRLLTEFGNLRGAFSWSLEPGEGERAELRLRLAAALWRFWSAQRFEEGKQWLQAALERDPGGFPAVRAKALSGFGFILLFQQDYGRAISALEEAIALYKALGDGSGAALALGNLGYAVLHGGYRERVPAFVQEAEALMAGDLDGHARAFLGIVVACAEMEEGDLDSAVSRLEESLALCRELGDFRNTSMSLFILGMTELNRGDFERGAAMLEEGARITRELGDRLGVLYFALGMGKLSVLREKPVRAATLWGAAEALREQLGMPLSRFDLAHSGYEQDLAAARSALDEASFDAAWTEGREMSTEQAIEFALGEPATPHEEIPTDRFSPAHSDEVEGPKEDAGGDRRHNLPVAQSGFVGREREMSEVKRTLSMTRLLTLTGAGGCGKTRLALEVARDLTGAYPDGVWLVELASLSEEALVPNSVAAALGVRKQPDIPFTDSLVDFLGSRRILLVLDNCEHLIEACARLVDTLLGSCEHLRVMATSREALGVVGEVNWLVPSLGVPDAGQLLSPESLARYEAVELFVERARSRSPTFVLTPENAPAVVDVCRRLDGIPLAIELATARMGALSVEQIAERLRDSLGFLTTGDRTRAPRQRTLKAALAWGYELLSEPERKLFGRLSVFVGGWTLEAAEEVCSGDGIGEGQDPHGRVSNPPVLDLLSQLVDKSLVVAEADRAGAPRYRLLETVRQYASGRLGYAGEEEAVRQRHALFFLELAERAEPELSGAEQAAWLDRLERELGNLRAAVGYFRASGQRTAHLRLAGSLWRFCYLRGHYEEGRGWLEGALGSGDGAPPPARAKALLGAGVLTFLQCEYDRARGRLEEALDLYRDLGDDRGVASAAQMLGSIARERGDYAHSEALHEESLTLWRELGDEAGEARSLNYLGYVAWLQEKHERARELCEETLVRFRRLGDNEGIAWALISLGSSALYAGDRRRAQALLEESLALSREVGYKEGVAWSLNQLGVLAHREGDHGQATDLLRESLEIHQNLGDRWRTASVLEAMAEALCARGRPEPAARLFGAAEAVREAISVPVPLCERADREESISAARDELGEAAFEEASSEGRVMSPEQAVEYASAEPMPSYEEDAHPPAAEAAALRIFALGQARVEKGRRPLASPDWIQKPRELLYYLLSHPPRTKEQIGLALWPEASTTQLRSSFHDTVYRLRRALGGKEWIFFENGRYTFGRSLPYFFDAEAFEKNTSEARRIQSEAPERAIRHLQEATDLYGGDFLEDFADSDWAMARQEELRREYQEALLLLGRLLFARGRYAEAAGAYRKAVAHDAYLEEAHRELMRCQAALGERGRALRQYEELVELLDKQLGTRPAPETTALYESIRAGEQD
jgi:predicted ATPase/DNA-binding SARP family transcriptional activator